MVPGLISGIIIDTFSDMRGYKDAIEQDVFDSCFICNISREDFESSGVPFEQHVKNDHNMWKYLWFMVYLSEKDPTEFTGVEQFCQLAVSQQELRWLPIKAAKVLSKITDKYDLYSVYHKLLALQQGLGQTEERIKGELRRTDGRLRERMTASTRRLRDEAAQLRELLQRRMDSDSSKR